MRLYVKKTKNKQGIKEMLWIDIRHNGERYRKPLNLENTSKNRRIVEKQIIPIIQYKILTGEFFKNAIPTVSEYMKKSFELQKSNRKDRTSKDYKSKFNKHLIPIFGDKKLNEIKGTDITLWQNSMLDKNYAIRTIKSIRGMLSTLYEDAIKDEIVEKNPVRFASQLSKRNENRLKTGTEPFSLLEIQSIIENTQNEQMRNLYMCLFSTGLRGGEIIALRWNKINFLTKEISIVEQCSKGEFGPPKWESYRTVPIIDSLIPFLNSQFKITGDQNSFVFLNKENSHFWDISKITQRYWKNDLIKAKVPYRKLHATRHTFCSTMISSGEDINYVSKIAGHSSTKMTLEKYSKYIPNNIKGFGKAFNVLTV